MTQRTLSIALFVLLLAPLSMMSQIDNPVSGYLIKNSGDTLAGMLNLDNEKRLAKGVYLKENKQSQEESIYYTADTIQEVGFYASGLIYRVIEHEYLNREEETSTTAKRLAKVLYDGKLKLYRLGLAEDEYLKILSDIPPWAFYLQTETGDFVKLEVTEKQSSGSRYRVQPKYRGALKYVMRDWPDAVEAIDDTDFSDEALTALVQAYSEFKYPEDRDGKVETKKLRKISSYVTAGYSITPNLDDSDLINASWGLGFLLKFYDPLANNALEVSLGAEYWNISYSDKEQFIANNWIEGAWTARLPLSAEYYLSRKNTAFQPRVSLAGVLYFLQFNRARADGPTDTISFKDQTVRIAIRAGVGADIAERFRLDVHYERRMGIMLNLGAKLF